VQLVLEVFTLLGVSWVILILLARPERREEACSCPACLSAHECDFVAGACWRCGREVGQ
jgi:hypothetical protein